MIQKVSSVDDNDLSTLRSRFNKEYNILLNKGFKEDTISCILFCINEGFPTEKLIGGTLEKIDTIYSKSVSDSILIAADIGKSMGKTHLILIQVDI